MHQNSKFHFLKHNSNPTLGDLLAQFPEVASSDIDKLPQLITKLYEDVAALNLPIGILNLFNQLKSQIVQNDILEAETTIKHSISRIKLLHKNDNIQSQIQAITKKLELAYQIKYSINPKEKALFLLSDLLFLDATVYTLLSEIKEKVSTEAFTLYIAFQTIGCVNGDGWQYGIFGNMPQLVPFISTAFETLKYPKMAEAIKKIIDVFPKNTSFLFDDKEYIDTLNFMENPRFKIENPKLNFYTTEQRNEFCKNYKEVLQNLEALEYEIWKEATHSEFENIYKFYDHYLETSVFKK